MKLRLANLGKSPSLETRKKLGIARLGYRLSDDAKFRIGNAARGRNLGEKSGVSKLSNKQREEICQLSLIGRTTRELAEMYQVDASTVRREVRFNRWRSQA